MQQDWSKLKILFVDDEAFMRSLVIRMLISLGADAKNITKAKDGMSAKRKLITGLPHFDLIILDLEMPLMGGLELLTFVRQSGQTRNPDVPVIVLTGHSDKEHLRDATKIGIHGFLLKPVSSALLQRQIDHALTSRIIDGSLIDFAMLEYNIALHQTGAEESSDDDSDETIKDNLKNTE